MRPHFHKLMLLAFCLLAGSILSVIDRTDANWDLQNYHLYAPFAVLHGRLGADYFAAGMQGYLNPLADIPYYIVKFIWFPAYPRIVAGLAGLPFGVLAFIVFNIARIILPDSPKEAAMAALLGLTGATILSEVGTVYDDILNADILLSGVWIALAKSRNPAFAAMLAGLALGIAAALKLTAVFFAPGMLLLCLIQANQTRRVLQSALLFAIGAAVGFLAFWGWWGVLLWERFHNPFFPFLGTIFPSPWSPAIFIHDVRFFPRNPMQWLFYPFYWLQGRPFIATEEPLRDPRFALAYTALTAGLFAVLKRRAARPNRQVTALWAFFVTSYFLWLIGFSILRYAISLEAISGIVIWTAIRPIFRNSAPWMLAGICVAVIAFTKPIGWGRIGYGKTPVEAPVPKLAPQSVVFLTGAPLGFVVPYLNSQGSAFISLDWLAAGSAEVEVVQSLLRNEPPIRLLTNASVDTADSAAINARLAPFGLVYSETACLPVHSPLQRSIRLCDVQHLR